MEVRRLGKYELRATRGRGAMGTVYESWDTVIARRVAIKTVALPEPSDPEAQEALGRFRREAQAAGRLSHPHIVAVHDYGETDELAYIVMEFIDGEALKARIDSGERFTQGAIRTLMGQLLDGLGFCHGLGVVHRDIKPGNLMLTKQGVLKITDFGIARIEANSSMTQSGDMLGTPAYMSPEQFKGSASDARTDLYSAGALLYQLLTGRRPFEGSTTAIMHMVLSAAPPRPSVIDFALAPLDAVVARAMAKDPARRFADAAGVARAMNEGFETMGVAAEPVAPSSVAVAPPARQDEATEIRRPASAPVPVRPPRRRRAGWLIGGMALGVAALVVLGRESLWPPAPEPPTPELLPIVAAPPPLLTAPPRPKPSLASLRAAVAPVECTLTNPQFGNDGGIYVSGLTRRGRSEAALRDAVGALAGETKVAWSLTGIDGPYCEALNVLRPLRERDTRDSAALRVFLKDNITRLVEDERAILRITMPEFPAHLRIDYLSQDGSVSHLMLDDGADMLVWSRAGMQRIGPSHRYLAGETLTIGEPDAALRFGGWEISEPFGSDLLVVIASSVPLPAAAVDSATVYFRDLRAALEDAEAKGAMVSAQALTLETVAKAGTPSKPP